MSALKAYNAMSSPGGAAISLYALALPWSEHFECTLLAAEIATDF